MMTNAKRWDSYLKWFGSGLAIRPTFRYKKKQKQPKKLKITEANLFLTEKTYKEEIPYSFFQKGGKVCFFDFIIICPLCLVSRGEFF